MPKLASLCCFKLRNRFLRQALALQKIAQINARFSIIGLDSEGLLVVPPCLRIPSVALQEKAQVVVYLGSIGIDFQGLPVLFHCFCCPT